VNKLIWESNNKKKYNIVPENFCQVLRRFGATPWNFKIFFNYIVFFSYFLFHFDWILCKFVI
jgi:hypothetical protein